jgi:hypothetical protein
VQLINGHSYWFSTTVIHMRSASVKSSFGRRSPITYRAAVPRLRMIAAGEDHSATVHRALVAASLLARSAVTDPRHVLLAPSAFGEIAGRAVLISFQPIESQYPDFISAFDARFHEVQNGLN